MHISKVKIMENNLIMFNSVTLAMRARDILGFNNAVENNGGNCIFI